MAKLIKQLQNNRSIVFDNGKFDSFCVYIVEANGIRSAPFDQTYFSGLKSISTKYPNHKVYNDFISIYSITIKEIEEKALLKIDEIVSTYNNEDKPIIEQWFTVLYAGMIAEENKQRTKLGKRVKMLGMHQVLILNMPAEEAAKFSYGKKWEELDAIMRPLGF